MKKNKHKTQDSMDNPEAFLDALTIRSLKERYHGNVNQEIMGVTKDAIPACLTSNEDLELFVRDFTIDDSISDCFADSDCDTPTVIGVDCKPSSKLTPSLPTRSLTSQHNDSVVTQDSDQATTSSNKRHNIVSSLFHRKHKKSDNSCGQSSSTVDKTSRVTQGQNNGHVLKLENAPKKHTRSRKAERNYCNCQNTSKHHARLALSDSKETSPPVDPARHDSPSCLKADEFYSDQKVTRTKSARCKNTAGQRVVANSSTGCDNARDQIKISSAPVCKSASCNKIADAGYDDNSMKKDKRSKSNKSKFSLDWILDSTVKRSKKNNKASKNGTCGSNDSRSSNVEIFPSSDLEKPTGDTEIDTLPGVDFSAITDATFDELFLRHPRSKLQAKSQSKSEPRLRTRDRGTGTTVLTQAEVSLRRKSDGYTHSQAIQNHTSDVLNCRQYHYSENVRDITLPSERSYGDSIVVHSKGKFSRNDQINTRKPSPWYDTDSDDSINGATSRGRKYRYRNNGRVTICDVIDHSAASDLMSKSSSSTLKTKSRLSKSYEGFDKITPPLEWYQGSVKRREGFCDNPHCRYNFACNNLTAKERPCAAFRAKSGHRVSFSRTVSGSAGVYSVEDKATPCDKARLNDSLPESARRKFEHEVPVCDANSKDRAAFSNAYERGNDLLHAKDTDFHTGESSSPVITAADSSDANNNNIIINNNSSSSSSSNSNNDNGSGNKVSLHIQNQSCTCQSCCWCRNATTNSTVVGDTTSVGSKQKKFSSTITTATVTGNSAATTATTTTAPSWCTNDSIHHVDSTTCFTTEHTERDASVDYVQLKRSDLTEGDASQACGLCYRPQNSIGSSNDNKSWFDGEDDTFRQAEQMTVLEIVTMELFKRLMLTEHRHERLAKTVTHFLTAFDGEDALQTVCRAVEQLQLLVNFNGLTADGARISAKGITDLQNVVDVMVGLRSSLEEIKNPEGAWLSRMTVAEGADTDDSDIYTIARSFLQEVCTMPSDTQRELPHHIQTLITNHLHLQPESSQVNSTVNSSESVVSKNDLSNRMLNTVMELPDSDQNGAALNTGDGKPNTSAHLQEYHSSGGRTVDKNSENHSLDSLYNLRNTYEATRKRQRFIPETGFTDHSGESPSHERKRRVTMSQLYSSSMPQGLQREHYLDDWSYEESDSEGEFDDDDDDDDDDSDDERDVVKLNVENEDVPHEELRHHRLRRHLQSVEKLRHNNDDLIETVVTGTGETLTPFSQAQKVTRVHEGETWSSSTASPNTQASKLCNTERSPNGMSEPKENEHLARSPQKSGVSRTKKMFRFRLFRHEKNSVKEAEISDDESKGKLDRKTSSQCPVIT